MAPTTTSSISTHQQLGSVLLQQRSGQPHSVRAHGRLAGGLITRGFRGAKLLAPLLGAQEHEQHQQQSSVKQQQAQPVAQKAAGLLSWVGSTGDKQDAAQEQRPEQQQQLEDQPARPDTAMPSDYMALLFVSLLWGSYTPALRYLYSMDQLLTPQVCVVLWATPYPAAWWCCYDCTVCGPGTASPQHPVVLSTVLQSCCCRQR